MQESADGRARGGVQSLDRAFAILEAMADAGGVIGLSQLATDSGLPLATIHRLVRTLVDLGYVRQEPSRQYSLGPRLMRLADGSTKRLGTLAQPAMQAVVSQLGESVNLAVLDGEEIVYVAQVQPSQNFMRMFTEVGRRAKPHATAVGKAMLAWIDDRSLAAVYGDRLGTRTHHTLTTFEALRHELALIRSRHGLAFDREELTPGSVAVAVAIRGSGRASGAIQLAGDPRRVSLDRLTPYVTEAARKVSRVLHPAPRTRHRSRTVEATVSEWPPGALDQVMEGISGDYWI
jgi:IclR family acetate operon transcriptional repressor